MELTPLLDQLPSDDQNKKGLLFEKLTRWYLENSPNYKGMFKRIWLWSEWPEAWGGDAGIDLVAEGVDGALWAIQSKAYDTKYSVTKKDVDSFLSESSRKVFSHRLLIATTDKIGKTASRTIEQQEKPVYLVMRTALEEADIEWPNSFNELNPIKQKAKKPLPHQKEALMDIRKGFKTNSKGQVIMCCGTGKTLTSLWCTEKFAEDRILILLPSLSLLSQTLREWRENRTKNFTYLAVCSDETVVSKDEPITHTSELGIPVTTNPKDIKDFLEGKGRRIIFSTYQSSPQIAEAYKLGAPELDLIIADEAHRCTGPVGSNFTTVLHEDKIRSKRRLFFTATPRYFTGKIKKQAQESEYEIASMDDHDLFGPVFHKLNFGEAIERELLSDYQVVVVGVNDEMIKQYTEKAAFVTTDGVKSRDARTLASEIALLKTIRKYDLKKVITFHSRVNLASSFSKNIVETSQWMPKRQTPKGTLWTQPVSGDMSTGKRNGLLHHFRNLDENERGILSNARCLAEGVDVPSIDGVAFIDPRKSQIDIIQAVGRAIRKTQEEKIGTIVIPVFIKDEDPSLALNDSAFKPVWEVLKALRSHDDTLAEQLDQLRRELGARGTLSNPVDKLQLDLPIHISKDFVDAFEIKTVESTTESWEFWFGLLEQFVEENGHALVPSTYLTKSGFKLGRWVSDQRKNYSKDFMPLERIEKLESLLGWTWSSFDQKFINNYNLLLEFVAKNNSALVPNRYICENGTKLGSWIIEQRKLYRKGKLPRERVEKLTAVPGWSWDPLEDEFNRGYEFLLSFIKNEGHSRPADKYITKEGFRLGGWVGSQRQSYFKNKMSKDRTTKLELLPGWSWDPSKDDFYTKYQILEKYVLDRGSVELPRNTIIEGINLSNWARNVRKSYSRATLPKEYIDALEKLEGWQWDIDRNNYGEAYEKIKHFVAEYNHAKVPQGYIDDKGFKLGSWVSSRREDYKEGILNYQAIDILESFPGWSWDLFEDAFEEKYTLLSEFVKREGHALVPISYKEKNINLGSWIAHRRQEYKKGNMAKELVDKFESLPGWSWDPLEDDFNKKYNLLKEYMEKEGHSRVPISYKHAEVPLGIWVSSQRTNYKKGGLPNDKINLFESLLGWSWNPLEDDFKYKYNLLLNFTEREGHSKVPQRYQENGISLGRWIVTIRSNYKKGILPPDKIQLFEFLPEWEW